MKPGLLLVLLLWFSFQLAAQTRVIEGKLLNLAGEPITNATCILDTPQKEQTTTATDGSFRFETIEYPTSVNLINENNNTLVPGEISFEIFDLMGRSIIRGSGVLTPGYEMQLPSNFNGRLKPNSIYFRKITDQRNNQLADRFFYEPNSAQETLKSGSTTTSETFGYKISFSGDSFADTILHVTNFLTTELYHYEDFFVNEFPLVIGNYSGERFNADTLKVSLLGLIKTDDLLKYELIFNSGNGNALTRNDSLLVYGTTNLDLKAVDGKGQSVVIPGLNFEQYVTLYGLTLDLAKDTSLNASKTYTVTEADFIAKRKQGSMHFRIFNKDNSFVEDLVSDANGNYSIELPSKGKYGIEIFSDGNMHPMMYMVIADSVKNNENIAGINKSFSTFNFAQSHIGCYVDGSGNLFSYGGEIRTFCWDPEVLEKGLKFLFLNRTVSEKTAELGDTITQAMKDLVINDRKKINPYFNNFFDNENIIFVDDLTNFTADGVVNASYMTDMTFGGANGKGIKNGVVVWTGVALNKDVYDRYLRGDNWILSVDFQENASMYGAFFEGWVEEQGKPTNWFKGSPYTSFTEDSKKAQMFYNWLSNKFISEGTPAEGFHPSLITSRIAKEFSGNTFVTNYISTHEIQKVKEKYNIN